MKIDPPFIERKLSEPFELDENDSPFGLQLMRPGIRPAELPGIGNVAAVMLLIFFDRQSNKSKIVLTRRQSALRHHPGQISLPGGRQETGERLEETAIRESVEEIGAGRDHINILGMLNSVYVPPSDFMIHPFVGWYAGRNDFVRSDDEVAEILEVPIEFFLQESSLQTGLIHQEKRRIATAFFEIRGYQVWGATAKILYELALRLSGTP